MDAPGEDPTGYHDRVLGLMGAGDILPHQYPTVDIPGRTIHLVTNPTRVPTIAAMVTHLSADVGHEYDANTGTVYRS